MLVIMRTICTLVLASCVVSAVAFAQAPAGAAAPADSARMNHAIDLYRAGDLGHAREELVTIHRADPRNVQAAVLLGFTCVRMNRDAEAYDAVASLEAGNESNLDLEYVLAYAMMRTGRIQEGVMRMEKVAGAKAAPDAWMMAGVTRYENGQYREALADAEEAVRIKPEYPGARTLIGKAHYALNDTKDAIEAFRLALRADPNDFDANLYLGVIHSHEKDYADAKALLSLALSQRPGYPLVRLELARIDRATGNDAEALTILESLVKTDPNWSEPHMMLSSLYFLMNRPEDGKRERAIAQRLQEQAPGR
jgi:tetratricopeptide (TPR) repeat protein